MLKILPEHAVRTFSLLLCLATNFTLHVPPNFPIMLVLSIIILQHCCNIVISYMHFFDFFKVTAWGDSWVIGMSSHSIFFISCIEREPGVTQDDL